MAIPISKIIEEFYEHEAESSESRAVRAPVTLRVDQPSLAMLQSLADRFGTTRSSLGCELLESAVQHAFQMLNDADRRTVGAAADDLHRKMIEDVNKSGKGRLGLAGGYWVGLAELACQIDGDAKNAGQEKS